MVTYWAIGPTLTELSAWPTKHWLKEMPQIRRRLSICAPRGPGSRKAMLHGGRIFDVGRQIPSTDTSPRSRAGNWRNARLRSKASVAAWPHDDYRCWRLVCRLSAGMKLVKFNSYIGVRIPGA